MIEIKLSRSYQRSRFSETLGVSLRQTHVVLFNRYKETKGASFELTETEAYQLSIALFQAAYDLHETRVTNQLTERSITNEG